MKILDRVVDLQSAQHFLIRGIRDEVHRVRAEYNVAHEEVTVRLIVSREAQRLLAEHDSNRYVPTDPMVRFMGMRYFIDPEMTGVEFEVAVVLP